GDHPSMLCFPAGPEQIRGACPLAQRGNMTRRDTPIEVALKGASAGLAGTLALTIAMRAVAELIASLPRSQTEARGSQAGAAPLDRLVGKVARGIFDRDLPP